MSADDKELANSLRRNVLHIIDDRRESDHHIPDDRREAEGEHCGLRWEIGVEYPPWGEPRVVSHECYVYIPPDHPRGDLEVLQRSWIYWGSYGSQHEAEFAAHAYCEELAANPFWRALAAYRQAVIAPNCPWPETCADALVMADWCEENGHGEVAKALRGRPRGAGEPQGL